MQLLKIVFLCQLLRKNIESMKNITTNTQIFCKLWANFHLLQENLKPLQGRLTLKIFVMAIFLVLLVLDFHSRMVKTPFLDK